MVKKSEKENFNNKKKSKKSEIRKVRKNPKNINKKKDVIEFLKEKKVIILIIIFFIVNTVLTIWCAKGNYVNYVSIEGRKVLMGKTSNLLFGRNYVGLIITSFIYFYGLILNKFFLKKDINKLRALVLFVGLLLFNILMFYLFTNKVY